MVPRDGRNRSAHFCSRCGARDRPRRTTLSKQVRAGIIRSHDGKVRLSEVLADRAANIDLSRSKRREGEIDEPARAALTPVPSAPIDTGQDERDDDSDEPGVIMVDGEAMPYADARALKETYLAWLKRLEYKTKRGELAPVSAMAGNV